MPAKKGTDAVLKTAGDIHAHIGGKPRVHVHALPRCTDARHDSGCDGKGAELTCNQVTVFGKKFAVCTHIA